MKTVAMFAFLCLPLCAQDAELDPITKGWIEQLTRRLELSSEQTKSITDIYKEVEGKVGDVLTEDQKKGYKDLRAREGGRTQSEGRRGGGGNWMERFMGPQIDQLKESLGLTEEQSEEINEILSTFRKSAEERFAELREQGFQGMDWREEMQKFRERMNELTSKVQEHLTPEQKEKYEELLQNRNQFGGGRRESGERSSRRNSPEQRLERIMNDLEIENEEERAAISEIISETMNADRALNEYLRKMRQDVQEVVESDLGEEAIDAQLQELRTTRRTHEKTLSTLRKELAEIVTYRQEAVLVRHGILK